MCHQHAVPRCAPAPGPSAGLRHGRPQRLPQPRCPPPGARPSAWGGAAALGQGVGREVGQDKQRPQSRSAAAPPAHTAERCNNSPGPPPLSKGPSSARRGGERGRRPAGAEGGSALPCLPRAVTVGPSSQLGARHEGPSRPRSAHMVGARAGLATPPFRLWPRPPPLATPPCPSRSVLPRTPLAPPRAHPRQWEPRQDAAAPISAREERARRAFTVPMEMRDAAMQHGARRGPETPQGVALTGHVVPVDPADGPPRGIRLRGEVLLPVLSPCRRDTVVAVAEEPQEVMTTPNEDSPEVVDTEEDDHEVPLTQTEESVPTTKELPEVPAEQLRRSVPRGTCLIHNWQEERATNHLDDVVPPQLGSEGFVHRQELMEEIHSPPSPMEILSTTHRDYQAGGFQPTPPTTTQPHNYHMEQPRSFWLERAHSLPVSTRILPHHPAVPTAHRDLPISPLQGVTCIRTGDSPFRRNAAFSTPITEYLEQPLPYEAASRRPWPSMQ
eukprot:XP_025000606.1 sperm-associated antigen 8 isoform X3 [Gallus gallus]